MAVRQVGDAMEGALEQRRINDYEKVKGPGSWVNRDYAGPGGGLYSGPGGPDGAGGGGGTGGGMTNTVAPDPGVAKVQGQLDDYIKGIPGAAGDTMETAGMKTRDAFEGVFKGLDERAARGGVAGTSTHELRRYTSGGDLARALSAQNRDIALGSRAQAGQMLLGQGNLALGQGNLQQGQQRIGLDQYGLGLQEQNQGYQQRLALAGLYPQYQQQSGSGY